MSWGGKVRAQRRRNVLSPSRGQNFKIKVSAGPPCSLWRRTLGEGPSCLFQLLVAPGLLGSWTHPSNLCLRLHVAFLLCVSESKFPSSYKDGLGPTLVHTHLTFQPQQVGLELRDSSLVTSTAILLRIREHRPTSAHTGHWDLSESPFPHL